MRYTAQVVQVLESWPLEEGAEAQLDNLAGLYRLTTADNVVTYIQGEMANWDPDRDGSVLGAGHSVLLWFGVGESRISYYATSSTTTPARLERVRLVPDEEIREAQ